MKSLSEISQRINRFLQALFDNKKILNEWKLLRAKVDIIGEHSTLFHRNDFIDGTRKSGSYRKPNFEHINCNTMTWSSFIKKKKKNSELSKMLRKNVYYNIFRVIEDTRFSISLNMIMLSCGSHSNTSRDEHWP